MLEGSKRKEDMRAEQELATFLDKYFYRRLKESTTDLHCIRHNEELAQKAGIDVAIHSSDSPTMYVDEKVSIYYRNGMIPTFAFEVNSIQRKLGKRIPGWLVNDDLKTTHYLLVWANVKCDNKTLKMKEVKDITEDEFTIVEALLISKKKITEYLDSKGYTTEKIIEKANDILAKGTPKNTYVGQRNFHFCYSTHLAEKPINVVIQRRKLLELASRAYYIGQDGLARFK